MTVIISLIEGGEVHLAADTATTAWQIFQDTQPKLSQLSNGMLIGTCGSVHAGNILEFGFTPPKLEEGQDLNAYMRWTFPNAFRSAFRDHRHLPITDNTEDSLVGALIGWRGQVWQLHGDFSVTQSVEPYQAIGSGGELALAVLHATPQLPARERLELALSTAAHYNPYCRAPFSFRSLPPHA